MKSLIKVERLDQWGMTASIACAIHCAALPLVTTALPLLGLEFLANVWVEIIMIILSLVLGTWSLLGTFGKHKDIMPILILTIGFLFISGGHFIWHDLEAILIPLGGFTLAGAHFINWKLVRTCSHNHSPNVGNELK
ncbi:MAG: MerC domain-containing protein [Pedobacter sp.]